MKLKSKTLVLFFLLSFFNQSYAFPINISGKLTSQEEKILTRIIDRDFFPLKPFILRDIHNPYCEKKIGFILQICITKLEVHIIYQKRKKLKKTIGRLIKMFSLSKGGIKKASPKGRLL